MLGVWQIRNNDNICISFFLIILFCCWIDQSFTEKIKLTITSGCYVYSCVFFHLNIHHKKHDKHLGGSFLYTLRHLCSCARTCGQCTTRHLKGMTTSPVAVQDVMMTSCPCPTPLTCRLVMTSPSMTPPSLGRTQWRTWTPCLSPCIPYRSAVGLTLSTCPSATSPSYSTGAGRGGRQSSTDKQVGLELLKPMSLGISSSSCKGFN